MSEKELVKVFRELGSKDQSALLSFARFLKQQASAGSKVQAATAAAPAPLETPADIPRPPQETVVAAIKRLTATFPMLDKAKLLNETSGLVAEHVMQGCDAVDVINRMEDIFRNHYERYRREREQS